VHTLKFACRLKITLNQWQSRGARQENGYHSLISLVTTTWNMCTATIRNNSNKKQLSYWRNLCFEHYVYLIKTQRIICTKMPMAVRRWFQNCSNMVPTRMTQVEIYGTLAASSEATQLVEALSMGCIFL
jgi:hypothetical protein